MNKKELFRNYSMFSCAVNKEDGDKQESVIDAEKISKELDATEEIEKVSQMDSALVFIIYFGNHKV